MNAAELNHPCRRGSQQNSPTFLPGKRSSLRIRITTPLPAIAWVQEYMDKVNEKDIGTDYKPFNYYGAVDAEHVIVAMGICLAIRRRDD